MTRPSGTDRKNGPLASGGRFTTSNREGEAWPTGRTYLSRVSFGPKGILVRDSRDSRERRLLEFLIPIVHPDKPTRVTRTIGNTIFGALSGDRPVDWGKVFSDLVHRLVGGASKAKPTPFCPFLYHLYECRGLLTEEEETDYTTAEELNRYEIPPEQDENSDSGVL